jgi:hypothetical protein
LTDELCTIGAKQFGAVSFKDDYALLCEIEMLWAAEPKKCSASSSNAEVACCAVSFGDFDSLLQRIGDAKTY